MICISLLNECSLPTLALLYSGWLNCSARVSVSEWYVYHIYVYIYIYIVITCDNTIYNVYYNIYYSMYYIYMYVYIHIHIYIHIYCGTVKGWPEDGEA